MKICRLFVIAAVAAVMSSCATSHTLTYMQDLVAGEVMDVPQAPEITVKPKDKLRIVVSSKNPQLSLPFNIVDVSFNLEGTEGGEVRKTNVKSDPNRGYDVDLNGNIEMPVLGMLHVEGKTLSQIKSMIANALVDGNYIKEPTVTVDFLNFKYTILGEVSHKGNLPVYDNSINLLQAIANAGDLSTAANYKDVKVIRTRNGKREVFSVNMYTKDLFNSPAFYIQQDDIIYVKPRGSKWNQDADRAMALFTTSLTVISLASNIFLWARIYK